MVDMSGHVRVASLEELPVIDIGALHGDNTKQKLTIAKSIHEACVQTGFFYITGHSVEQQQLFTCIKELFALPLDNKLKLDAKFSPLHRGYTGLGGAHNCVPEESCVVGPDNKESFLLGAEGSTSSMHGNNTWPDAAQLPGWQQHISTYFASMLDLSRVVARGLALSLGLPEHFFDDKMQDPVAQLLLLRYPPPPPSPPTAKTAASTQSEEQCTGAGAAAQQPPQQDPNSQQQQQQRRHVGCGAHTDCGFLTILAQDNVPGLQVKMKSGTWVTAPAIPGAFLVNLGDMTACWTNGLYKSTEHRVFNSSSQPRYSAPFFCNCDFDAIVEPAAMAAAGAVEIGGTDKSDQQYKPVKAGHYIMQKLGLMWDEGVKA